MFVFDGKTPSLKTKTLKQRKRQQISQRQGDLRKHAERLLKKYLNEATTTLREKRNKDEISEIEASSTLTQQQQDVMKSIAMIAFNAAEEENRQLMKQEKDYDDDLIRSLIIEYGLLLQESGVDLTMFSGLESEKQYELITTLKHKKQQDENIKLEAKKDNIEEYSKASIQSYIEGVNEKQKLRQYRIKAGDEYKKSSNYDQKSKQIVYKPNNPIKPVNKLPDIFNNQNPKKKKRKVDQMIQEMEQHHINELKNSLPTIHENIDEVEMITLNPVDIFKKLELGNKVKKVDVDKLTETKLKQLKIYEEDEGEALWGSNEKQENADPFA